VAFDVSEAKVEILREQIIPALIAIVDDAGALGDPAALEHLAGLLLVAIEQPELPDDAVGAILEAIEARRDADAAGVLAALGLLAGEQIAVRARAGARRLADAGIISNAETALGTLVVDEAVSLDGPGAELLAVLLRRPGAADVQAVLLGIEHEETGGALIQCALMPPAPVAEARELLDGVDAASAAVSIAEGELAARVVAAAKRAIDEQIALGPESGPSWPIVSRALTGSPTGLPRPEMLAPWEDDDSELTVNAAEDEEDYQRVVDMLLEELEQHARAEHPPGGVVWRYVDFVASTMLQWKGDYDDGRLGHWNREDLAEFLLAYFPRKVTVEEQTVDAVPECVSAFLGFLDARGSLSGEPLEALMQACEDLRDEFHERACDSSAWGPAKSMVMEMIAEGLDPSEPGALENWMADFNERPRDQRDAIIGPATDRMIGAAGPALGATPHAPKQRSQRRKAQRAARKRNRR
jgi:hypothetical protein